MKIILILALFFFSITLNAQETNEDKSLGNIGFTFSSFGENDVFQSSDLVGGAGYSDDYFYSLGITYIQALNNWLDIETGLEYSKHRIMVSPHLPPYYINVADPYSANLSLLNIPLTLRANFLTYFFANGGLLLDIDISENSPIDSQTGIGAMMGIGAKYDFKGGASVFINPYLKFHSLLPFFPDNHHKKIFESGIRLGFVFNLRRK